MSTAHLTTGSTLPPKKDDGLLRLYSMNFCPFAQRVRLVLKAKNIPHEIVNINLINKPEWYFQIHPEGKVPALDVGSQIIVESLDICDWLEDHYPENPLYPSDPKAKELDKQMIQKWGAVIQVFYRCFFNINNEEKTSKEWVGEFLKVLEPFENELAKRGTTFFGGNHPGMLDYMIWPWTERAGIFALKFNEKPPLEDGQIPLLRRWRKEMQNDKVCAEIYTGPEKFWKVAQFKLQGLTPDYDSV